MAVVERFKQESMYGLSINVWTVNQCMDCPPGQKRVAVVERRPLVEVRLYII